MSATATAVRPKQRQPKPQLRKPLPLLNEADLPDHIKSYELSRHATERCAERGIHVMEVYSTIAAPTSVFAATDTRQTTYRRGDLSVVVDLDAQTIVTVIDLEGTERESPRKPLTPGVRKMARSSSKDRTALDEAWCLMEHKEMDIRKVLITPTLADHLLALNTHNRPRNGKSVNDFRADIREGRFLPTHQGVAIDWNQVLQDGQTRLEAIYEEGIGTWMWVAVGCDPKNFAVIDTGRVRSYGDVFRLQGESDTYVLGSTVRLSHLYTTRDYEQWNKGKVTNQVALDAFREDREAFLESMRVGRHVYTQKQISLTRTAAAAGFYVIVRVNKKATVERWFDGLATGADVPLGDPRHVLRRVLNNAAKEGKRGSGPQHLALLIKAWNAWAEEARITSLAWKKTESMPRVTKVKGAR